MTDREIVEKFVALAGACPLGHAHGHIITTRSYTTDELIAWLDDMHALRQQVQPPTDKGHTP